VADGAWIPLELDLVVHNQQHELAGAALANPRSYVCYRRLPDLLERCIAAQSADVISLRQVEKGHHTLEMWLEVDGKVVTRARSEFEVQTNSHARGMSEAFFNTSRLKVKRVVLGELLAYNVLDDMVGRSLDLL
jgi:hypothetical protein